MQQNSAEVFQIIRKKLFDTLPSDDAVADLAQSYVDVLNSAKKDQIRSLPFRKHSSRESGRLIPSILNSRHRRAVQGKRRISEDARPHPDSAPGSSRCHEFEREHLSRRLQHLDFNDIGTLEEVRKINPHFSNAISKDVADQGNALAERVDAKVEPPASTAQAVAKLVLMSSLDREGSAAGTSRKRDRRIRHRPSGEGLRDQECDQ